MRTICFERDVENINSKLLRRWLISAEQAKAATEESIFRGKKGALFTLALFGAKVKAKLLRFPKFITAWSAYEL